MVCLTQTSRRKLIAISRLHKAGIQHGNIISKNHFLYSPTGSVIIIDFSTASVHHCQGRMPLLTGNGPQPDQPVLCQELHRAEVMLSGKDEVPKNTMIPAIWVFMLQSLGIIFVILAITLGFALFHYSSGTDLGSTACCISTS